jgi:protein-L-isoaspartate(D-aspartate) O-methyltransferase
MSSLTPPKENTTAAKKLAEELTARGVLKTPALARAFSAVRRADFVPEDQRFFAYANEPLPIGERQTISQPYTVAFMLELLAPKAGDHILDVGHGSGWSSAILARIVGERGKVYAMEIIPKLCRFGKENVKKYPELTERIEFFCKSAENGLPKAAKGVGGFDGIIAAAEVGEVPQAWREELKIGGRLVYPKDGSLWKETKLLGGTAPVRRNPKFKKEEYPGFAFVPFVKEYQA